MTEQERIILENCHIHYENDTLEKEIALRVITETRKRFKEYLEKKKSEYGIDYIVNPIDMLNEIINEFFKED